MPGIIGFNDYFVVFFRDDIKDVERVTVNNELIESESAITQRAEPLGVFFVPNNPPFSLETLEVRASGRSNGADQTHIRQGVLERHAGLTKYYVIVVILLLAYWYLS